MFRGLTAINLDAKGRMAIPKRYRHAIEEGKAGQVVVTIDTEQRCLLLYPYAQWELIEQKLSELPSFNPITRRVQRLLMGHATELELDRNGRILLPQLLREYAAIDKTAMLVGQGKKFEVWGETQWQLARDGWLAEDLFNGGGGVPPELENLAL